MQEVVELINELNRLLKNDKRIIDLNEKEKIMENDSEVICLSRKKDQMEMTYNDLLKIYKEDSKEVNEARHNLYLAKKELESNDIVIEYLKAYQKVRILYDNINEILFGKYKTKVCN